ncbi:MAG: ABC transporter permease subunit [Candidatus Delongbacteria bacterium]|nr:ABC transporter permease subunit [Candidatus Delongbacteria bacterium]MBN2836971.1 ABC transporter permease subunit [Candidatus Delongbacteria bacterium]
MNKLFRFFSYIGPIIISIIIIGLIYFLVLSIIENFIKIDNVKLDMKFINTVYLDLKSPIVGTLLITFASVIISIPVGIATAVYLNEYSGKKFRNFGVNLFKYLSSVPSIIIGLFGLVLIITMNKIFNSDFRTGIAVSVFSLTLLILPYIVYSTISALSMVSDDLRITALSLGAKKYQNIIKVLLPESLIGVLGGIILSIGRAAEDTAVIMLTGVAAFAGIPSKFNDSYEALPFFIYYRSGEAQTDFEVLEMFVAALLLILISGLMTFFAGRMSEKFKRKLKGLK